MFRKHFRFQDPEAGAGGGGAGGDEGKTGDGKVRKDQTFSAEYVHELREENKTWRLKAKDNEDAAKAAAQKAAEADKAAEGKVKEASTAAEQRIIRTELKSLAREAGIVDLDGLKLVDTKDLKLDENGELVGGDKLIEKLKNDKPYLFKEPSTSHTGKKPAAEGGDKKKSALEMDDKERAAEAKRLGIRLR